MEEKSCHHRKNKRGLKDIELINHRLNRIDGQIKGIKKMINENVYCNDVLIQLSAVEEAIKNLSNVILEDHLYGCIADDLKEGNLGSLNEIVGLFKRLNK